MSAAERLQLTRDQLEADYVVARARWVRSAKDGSSLAEQERRRQACGEIMRAYMATKRPSSSG